MQDVLAALVREAMAGLGPWEPIPDARLAGIGRRCGPEEIVAAIAALDGLAREKTALPHWDGDAADDIARAQAMYMRILGAAASMHPASVSAGLASPEPDTRRWVTLALEGQGTAALSALRPARDDEADGTTRQFMSEAIRRIRSAAAS